jgi:hypothetical protein
VSDNDDEDDTENYILEPRAGDDVDYTENDILEPSAGKCETLCH